MHFSTSSLVLAVAAAGTISAQLPENPVNCPSDRPVQFTVKTIHASNVGVNFGELIPNFLPSSEPKTALISVKPNATETNIHVFELGPSGSLSVVVDGALAQSTTNTAISLNGPACLNSTTPSPNFHLLVSVEQNKSTDKFTLIPFEGNQLLMAETSGFAQWVACDSGDDEILTWTDRNDLGALDFGRVCNKVQLQVTGCSVAIGAHPPV